MIATQGEDVVQKLGAILSQLSSVIRSHLTGLPFTATSSVTISRGVTSRFHRVHALQVFAFLSRPDIVGVRRLRLDAS